MIRPIARRWALTCVVGTLALAACSSDDAGTDSTSVTDSSLVESVPGVTEAPPSTDAVSAPATVESTTAPPATDVAQTDVAQTDVTATDVTATEAPGVDVDGLAIVDFAFSQAVVPAGVEFTLTNDDDFAHTVSNRDGLFDVRVEGSSTSPLTIDRSGTYEIFCRIHPSMSGTIEVV